MSYDLHRQAAKASALELCADWAAVKGLIQQNLCWVLKAQVLSKVGTGYFCNDEKQGP